jgi:hypothetical protein
LTSVGERSNHTVTPEGRATVDHPANQPPDAAMPMTARPGNTRSAHELELPSVDAHHDCHLHKHPQLRRLNSIAE